MKNLQLQRIACHVRQGVVEGVFHAKSGHPGGSLSIADTLTYLYYAQMKVDPANPQWEDRDRLVLSKGHCCPALYSVLAEKGYFDKAELQKLRHIGAMLQGHPDMKGIPGVDMSSGSLGQGISAACGIALAGKLKKADWNVYAILGDGEIEEGQVWEAAMFAAHNKLDNLIAVVDNNNLQIDGRVSDVCSVYPIDEKFRAFGWEVFLADAHDFDSLEAAFTAAAAVKGKPAVVIQKSIKGKGVSFMEDKAGWHGKAPNKEQYEQAMAELKAAEAAMEG
ncbi:MAG: transketolase [Oscillospiraceae bacterium]|nr:transketolase [Oscillospiraceae bacterium]